MAEKDTNDKCKNMLERKREMIVYDSCHDVAIAECTASTEGDNGTTTRGWRYNMGR